jgi:hypothetical protein
MAESKRGAARLLHETRMAVLIGLASSQVSEVGMIVHSKYTLRCLYLQSAWMGCPHRMLWTVLQKGG